MVIAGIRKESFKLIRMHIMKIIINFSYFVAKVFAFVFDIAIDAMSVFPVIALFDASSFFFPPIPPGLVSSSLRLEPTFLNYKMIKYGNET